MQILHNTNLSNISWVKIGGKVDKLAFVENESELIDIVKRSRNDGDSIEIIGQGSNTLISDKGIRGTVIKSKVREIKISDKVFSENNGAEVDNEILSPLNQDGSGHSLGVKFDDIYYDETHNDTVLVTVSSGYPFASLINNTIGMGLTGLQWFAGIPGDVGGFVYNNVHGGKKLLSEYIKQVRVIDENDDVHTFNLRDLEFDYDYSIFHKRKLIILDATLKLFVGDKTKARDTALVWAKAKSVQPKNSLGSMFKNLSDVDKTRLNIPTNSTGYLIDKMLKLSGYRVGNAMIPTDANNNFILNMGDAKASDYLAVMNKVYDEAYEQYGIHLQNEVILKGFDDSEISRFIKHE